jgi:plastocyanin
MRVKRLIVFALIALLALSGLAHAEDFRKDFREALEARDRDRLYSIVEENRENIPGEIRSLLEEALKALEEEKERLLYMAEVMASIYEDLYGNGEFLEWIRERVFDKKLSPPVRSVPQGGVHTIEILESADTSESVFQPDNIVIGKNETVRWINNDISAHLLGSIPFFGKEGLMSPFIEPGRTWEHTFDETGEYYYVSFIHSSRIGKVKVTEFVEEAAVGR